LKTHNVTLMAEEEPVVPVDKFEFWGMGRRDTTRQEVYSSVERVLNIFKSSGLDVGLKETLTNKGNGHEVKDSLCNEEEDGNL